MLVSPTINSLHGRIRSITGTDPAADTEISETVPARRRWRFHALHFSLVTDNNPANRQIILHIDDGTNTFYRFTLATIQTATLEWFYSFSAIPSVEVRVTTKISAPMAPFLRGPGFYIYARGLNRHVGDSYSAPQLLVEEWIDP